MNKIFTIMLGVIIALSAIAAPQAGFRRDRTEKDVAAVQQHVKHIVKAEAKEDGEVINIEANNLLIEYLSYYGILDCAGVTGSNDSWTVYAYLYPEVDTYFTTYSSENEDIDMYVLNKNGQEIDLSVSIAGLLRTEKGIQFVATCADEEGNTYNINLTLFAPDEPKATTTLDFGEAAYVKFYGETQDYYIEGEREDYVVDLDILTKDLAGEYATDDFDASYTGLYKINTNAGTGKKDTVSVGHFFSLSATISLSGDKYTIAADMFATDSVLYHVTMTYIKPVATDTIYYTFPEPMDLTLYSGDYYGSAKGDPYLLQLDFYSNQIPGTYTTQAGDFYEYYTGLFIVSEDKKDTTYVAYEDIKMTITENEADYDLNVVYFASNKHCYIFSLKSEKPTAKETVQVNVDNAELIDYTAYGLFRVDATSTDPAVRLVITLVADKLEGSFTMADVHSMYSTVVVDKVEYQIVDAELTSRIDNDKKLVLEGWLLAKNSVKYEFVIKTAEEVGDAVENVNADVKATKRIENGQLIIEKNGQQYNVLGTVVK